MLSQHETVAGVQCHIKRILGRCGHIIAAAVHHAVVLAVVRLGGDLRNGAFPAGIVHTGAQHHRFILVDGLDVLLADGAFHPELAVRHNFHQHIRAVRLELLHGFQGLHRPGDLRLDCGVVDGILQLFQLDLLGLDVIFRLGDIRLQRLDLGGIGQLVIRTGILFFRLQLCDLLLVGCDLVFHPLDVHIALLEFQLHGFHIIGEKRIAGVHMVALLHRNLRNGL